MLSSIRRLLVLAICSLSVLEIQSAESSRVLDPKFHHLRSGPTVEWQEFADKQPEGARLDIRFQAEANSYEQSLFLRQDNVKFDWSVELNGKSIGKLQLIETDSTTLLPVPTGALRNGENVLSIVPPKTSEDILVGEFALVSKPVKAALSEAALAISVTDTDTRQGLPCRITIVNQNGALASLSAMREQTLAIRTGAVYTRAGRARLGILPGNYTVYASRGFEFGVSTQRVSIARGQSKTVRLRLHREVPTPGWVSCDTHIHTLTHSGHGDSTIEERMLTLAGENIEVPIATEHNLHIDYSELAGKLGFGSEFKPITGNEVTTASGHFNIFPTRAGSGPPDWKTRDWPQLMQVIRATPDTRVIILNHARDLHSNFRPFAATNFNAMTGENLRGFEFSFDALEVINSGALQSDMMQLCRDWFALLNYGRKVVAVAGSDSHDVNRYIVGQGRTYVASSTDEPPKVSVDEFCQNLLQGRALASLGLLTQMKVNHRFGVGDLATGLAKNLDVEVSVWGPAWTSADRVELYANGVKIREQLIGRETIGWPIKVHGGSTKNRALKASVHWNIPRPAHDVHVVAIASGPGVRAPFWPIPRPYQPTSTTWNPRVFALTNPIWVDADGDGKFTPARAYGRQLVQRNGTDPEKIIPALSRFDEAVAAQTASLCQAAGGDVRAPEFSNVLKVASEPVQRGFRAFIATLPPAKEANR